MESFVQSEVTGSERRNMGIEDVRNICDEQPNTVMLFEYTGENGETSPVRFASVQGVIPEIPLATNENPSGKGLLRFSIANSPVVAFVRVTQGFSYDEKTPTCEVVDPNTFSGGRFDFVRSTSK